MLFVVIGGCGFPGIVYFLVTTFGNTTDTLINSNSISEAKTRGTYVCGIKPISPIHLLANNFKFETKGGWVEKAWYGHTGGPTNITSGYTLNLFPVGNRTGIGHLLIINAKSQYNMCFIDDKYFDRIDSLPVNDSMKYYIMKEGKDNYISNEFNGNHIVDSFYIILEKN